jgi:chemotaxis protein MotB
MTEKNVTIIVKKSRRTHAGHHGGAWKVAYADFVTAMMAFFLVLWIIGQSKETRAAIAGYFRDPGVFEQARANGPIPGGDAGRNPAAVRRDVRLPDNDSERRRLLEEAARRVRAALARLPQLDRLKQQIEIQVTSEGLRIELVDSSEAVFFDNGSSTVKAPTRRLLLVIAEEIAKLEKPVIIEGHTDSRPYERSGGYTNWELSADRANAARRVLLERLHPGQVGGIRGFADVALRVPGDALDPRNRRVSLVVQAAGATLSMPVSGR